MILYISMITIYWKVTDYFLSRAVSNQTSLLSKKAESTWKSSKKRKLSAKSGRGGNPDKNSSIVKIFVVYDFLPSTRFYAENERKKSKKAETFRKKRKRWQPWVLHQLKPVLFNPLEQERFTPFYLNVFYTKTMSITRWCLKIIIFSWNLFQRKSLTKLYEN